MYGWSQTRHFYQRPHLYYRHESVAKSNLLYHYPPPPSPIKKNQQPPPPPPPKKKEEEERKRGRQGSQARRQAIVFQQPPKHDGGFGKSDRQNHWWTRLSSPRPGHIHTGCTTIELLGKKVANRPPRSKLVAKQRVVSALILAQPHPPGSPAPTTTRPRTKRRLTETTAPQTRRHRRQT